VTDPPRVVVAGHGPIAVGVCLSLTRAGFDVLAEAREHDAAVDAAIAAHPDVAMISADLPGGGIKTVRAIAETLPSVKVVVLSSRLSGEGLLSAVLAGARGYLGSDMSSEKLVSALRAVVAGEVAIPRRLTGHLLEELHGRDVARALVASHSGSRLTDREWEVLHLLAKDSSTATIAQQLSIAEVTVRRHVSSLLSKLGVGDRASAVELFRRRSNI
jgi:DNA-binding NarL/FixJ family response regulator